MKLHLPGWMAGNDSTSSTASLPATNNSEQKARALGNWNKAIKTVRLSSTAVSQLTTFAAMRAQKAQEGKDNWQAVRESLIKDTNSEPQSSRNPPPIEDQMREQQDDAAAASYWGNLFDDEGRETNAFACLMTAIFKFFYYEPGVAMDWERKITPEELHGILALFDWPTIISGDYWVKQGCSEDQKVPLVDASLKYYYEERDYAYILATRPGSQFQNTMSLLTIQGLTTYVADCIVCDPEQLYNGMNSFLQQRFGVLQDPTTGLPFKYATIPRSCFPRYPFKSVKAYIDNFDREFIPKHGNDIIHEALNGPPTSVVQHMRNQMNETLRVQMEIQKMQQEYSLFQAQMAMQRDMHSMMLMSVVGGTYYY